MRVLLLCCLITLAGSISAQYERGNTWLDANSATDINSRSSDYDLMDARIKAGQFVRDRLLVGAEVDLGFDDNLDVDIVLSPFLRYYLPPGQRTKFNFYGEMGLRLDIGDGLRNAITVAGGTEYALLPGVLLNAELRHDFSDRSFAGGTSINLGVNLLFGQADNDAGLADFTRRKGDLMLAANFGSFTVVSETLRFGSLNLAGGYFLSDQLVLTGGFAASHTFFEFPGLYERTFTGAMVATGLRYQWRNGKRLQPYAAAGLRYDYERRVDDISNSEDLSFTERALSADFAAGALYYLNRNVALDVGLQYRPTISGSGEFHGTRVTGRIGLNIFLPK